ncbi:hypothetical protein GCM10009613_21760 [Pseudonocardia kongjuensis]|uniref:Pilus assembly protein TadE n=1 Tax=Pseudonocardia kongjuensis TaxID=102227 RepID=A0ABN1XPY6_9PSEU
MVLTILAVLPVLAVLLVMAAQPLFELWDDRASERECAAAAAGRARPVPAPVPVPLPAPIQTGTPPAFPEALGDVSAVLSVPHPRRPAAALRAVH